MTQTDGLRACPHCGALGMRAATRCGACWTKLDPLAHAPGASGAGRRAVVVSAQGKGGEA